MKARFYYCWSNNGEWVYGHPPRLWAASDIVDTPEPTVHEFNKYLLSALGTDFPSHHPDMADTVLQDIEKLERGEVETAEWEGQGFWHRISRTTVTFEHAIFGECPEWPIWSCTLAQYKAALQGWRKFIDMPKSIDSELIVELPDGDPS